MQNCAINYNAVTCCCSATTCATDGIGTATDIVISFPLTTADGNPDLNPAVSPVVVVVVVFIVDAPQWLIPLLVAVTTRSWGRNRFLRRSALHKRVVPLAPTAASAF
jgi:hypothetical protein